MNHTEQRKKLRTLIAGPKCHSPASVFDPLSARVAEAVGFEIGLLSGSGVSATTLAAPAFCCRAISRSPPRSRRCGKSSLAHCFDSVMVI